MLADHSDHPPFEYSKINDQLFVGTNACCAIHFKKELLDQGVRADISMEAERIDAAAGAEYFLWLPTVDHTAPTMEKLSLGVVAIQELIDAGEKVYVHCRNGHGRGPSLAVAFFITQGLTLEQAIQAVKSKRDSMHLDPEQHKRLEEFETWYKTR